MTSLNSVPAGKAKPTFNATMSPSLRLFRNLGTEVGEGRCKNKAGHTRCRRRENSCQSSVVSRQLKLKTENCELRTSRGAISRVLWTAGRLAAAMGGPPGHAASARRGTR